MGNKSMSSAAISVVRVKILLIFFFNVFISVAEYSFIDITAPSSIAGKYGCMPTLFGSTTPMSDHILGSVVLSDRGSSTDITVQQGKEACSSSHVGVPVSSNSILLVDISSAYGCTTEAQA